MKIVIANIGSGNVNSVFNAITEAGMLPVISADAREWTEADLLVLPGVGSFDKYIKQAHALGLADVVQARVADSGKYSVGICVGMQALFEASPEGEMSGFGLFKGALSTFEIDDVPTAHMGWNFLSTSSNLFKTEDGWCDKFYFCHSYYAESSPHAIATTNNNATFASVVASQNLLGLQFHPEKSGKNGVALWKNIITTVKMGWEFNR